VDLQGWQQLEDHLEQRCVGRITLRVNHVLDWCMPTDRKIRQSDVPHFIPATDCPNCNGRTQASHAIGVSGGYSTTPMVANIFCQEMNNGFGGWIKYAEIITEDIPNEQRAE
jgi:hypothetical protein